MNRSTFLKNAASAAGQTLVQTAVLFLLYRYLVDQLGIEQVGVWAVVLATASAARLSELGLAGSVTKYVATYRARGDDRAAGEALQTAAISLAAILGVILVVIYPGLSGLLSHVLPAPALAQGRAVLPYALVSMWLGAVSGIWLGALDGCLRSDLRAGLVILSTFVFMGMVFVSVPRHGLVGLAASQIGQGVLLAVLGWVAIRRVIPDMPPVPVRWNSSRFREMLAYGVNVQVITAVMLLFEPTTKILLVRYGGLSSAGTFEMAQQLVMKMRALIVETNRVVVPVMAGMGGLGHDARGLYSRNIKYLLFLLTPLFAGLASLVPAISELWLGSYQSQFVTMGVCLTAAWYLNSVTAPAYFAYMGQGRLRWLTVSHILLGGSNVLLGVVLGPAFGWPGVIAAFVLSLTVGSLLPVWTYHREHGISVGHILSRGDVILMIVCLTAAAAGVGGYSVALSLDTPLWTRVALIAATTLMMLAAVWHHPLAPEVIMMVRHSRDVNKAR